ncbi:MAG: multifunctional CCA addition/repair protein [Gammaproteobacteria bacterium]
MEIYLVGGAVRDRLLGHEPRERDWVVVGASPEAMTEQGYRPVGRDFPVFLHPETGEEYALARTERKTSPGYRGFVIHAAPDVTLEEDLQRRDLTINAIAQDQQGQLIDPFGGRADLERRLLRHVSAAFNEDPVRVLRVARFAARFAGEGFRVAPETMALMRQMVESGEVDALVPERVWQETERALGECRPSVYIEVLRECGALQRIFPELDRLFGVPQPPRWHPEVDTGLHMLLVLDQAAQLSESIAVRFAALVHDLGKGTTPQHLLPAHHGHGERGAKIIGQLARRLRIPNECRDLALLVSRYHCLAHRAAELRADTILKLLERLDAFRRPQRFEAFLIACEADLRGRTGFEHRAYPQATLLRAACDAASAVEVDRSPGLSGEDIGRRLRQGRLQAVTASRAALKQSETASTGATPAAEGSDPQAKT